MAAKTSTTIKLSIELPACVATHINALIERMALADDRATSHGPLTVEGLAAMLLEDAAMTVRRPGSWEGAGMARVLESHGYEL